MDAQPSAGGGVLIADTYNNRIMLLSPNRPSRQSLRSQVVAAATTLGGTQSCEGVAASDVEVHHPDSVSELQNGSGGYVFAEYEESAVREVSQEAPTGTGTFTTVAGEPGSLGYTGDGGPATSAQLDVPEQVTGTPARRLS